MVFNHAKFERVCTDISVGSAAFCALSLASLFARDLVIKPIIEVVKERKAKKRAEKEMSQTNSNQIDEQILDFDPLLDQNEP